MSSISLKKRTKEFDFTTMIPQVDLFSFVFWRKSNTQKNHLEMIWSLVHISLSCRLQCIFVFLIFPGVLWQQRDKVFSRWKERYFVLTSDYLQCFKKSSPSVMHSAASEMGRFIFKLKLTEVSTQEIQQCTLKEFQNCFW